MNTSFRTLSLSRHTLGYAHNPLDRMANLRDDANAIPALHRDGTARVLAFAGERVLTRSPSEGPWFSVSEAGRFGDPRAMVFLGRLEGQGIFAYRFDPPAEESEGAPPTNDLRTMATAGAVPPAELGMLAQAKALFHWHFSHRFCANCGHPTDLAAWGWRRECPDCGLHHFPRTDPVVIMMAVDGDRCLLGRQPRFAPNMYSCLAGFLEPGETVEDAVRREIFEESGIETGAVVYLASQPWPFPSSIMLGCIAEATSTTITIDRTELEDARWFTREELRAIMAGQHPDGIICPPEMAIAHGLMRTWADL